MCTHALCTLHALTMHTRSHAVSWCSDVTWTSIFVAADPTQALALLAPAAWAWAAAVAAVLAVVVLAVVVAAAAHQQPCQSTDVVWTRPAGWSVVFALESSHRTALASTSKSASEVPKKQLPARRHQVRAWPPPQPLPPPTEARLGGVVVVVVVGWGGRWTARCCLGNLLVDRTRLRNRGEHGELHHAQ
jgi:hypothetical protein